MFWLFLLQLACGGCGSSPPADPGIGPGTWRLEAENAQGELILEEGRCSIGLWGTAEGAAWGTGGPEHKACEVEAQAPDAPEPGAWIYFNFRSGAGDGVAAARLDPTSPTLSVPLGNHALEGTLELTRTAGALTEAERVALSSEAEAAINTLQSGWAMGDLALMEGDRLVGEVHLGEGASVAVYDETWMTDGIVDATWRQDGATIVLQFVVMPALRGEEGLLRLNPVTGEARVPLGPYPTPDDRRLGIDLRMVTSDEAAAAIELAREQSVAREESIGGELARLLAEEVTREDGTCRPPETLPGDWPLWLAGYEVRVSPVDGVCEVVMDPDPVQHGRRLSVRARPSGVIEQVVRSLE